MTSSVPSWPAALAAAEAMTAVYRGKKRPDDGLWESGTRMLALALYRAAANQGTTVADAVIRSSMFGCLRSAQELMSGPFPPDAGELPAVDGDFDPVLRRADAILDRNYGERPVATDLQGLGTSDVGDPDSHLLTVGERLEEIVQDPKGQPPLPETGVADECARAVVRALGRSGTWVPTEAEVEVALVARKLRVPATDDFVWMGRMRRLARLGIVLHEIVDRDRAVVSPLLIDLFVAVAAVLDHVTRPLAGLEALWEARPAVQLLTAWERRHFPLGIRARVVEAEQAVMGSYVYALVEVCEYQDNH
uniref:hypothetical protein n=1 Tax=Amycolatopsis sp. CA-096443 TaxID=3239919 RepID=UPI003F49290D